MLPMRNGLASAMMQTEFVSFWDHTWPYKYRYQLGAPQLYDSVSIHDKNWRGELTDDKLGIIIRCMEWADDVPDVEIYRGTKIITDFDFAFDIQMSYVCTLEFDDNTTAIWWFNPATDVNAYALKYLTPGSIKPKCCLDSTKKTFLQDRDVIVTFVRDDTCWVLEHRTGFSELSGQAIEFIKDPYLIGRYVFKVGPTVVGRTGWDFRVLADL